MFEAETEKRSELNDFIKDMKEVIFNCRIRNLKATDISLLFLWTESRTQYVNNYDKNLLLPIFLLPKYILENYKETIDSNKLTSLSGYFAGNCKNEYPKYEKRFSSEKDVLPILRDLLNDYLYNITEDYHTSSTLRNFEVVFRDCITLKLTERDYGIIEKEIYPKFSVALNDLIEQMEFRLN